MNPIEVPQQTVVEQLLEDQALVAPILEIKKRVPHLVQDPMSRLLLVVLDVLFLALLEAVGHNAQVVQVHLPQIQMIHAIQM